MKKIRPKIYKSQLVKVRKMAAEPWARNMDELRNSTWMNYSNIDPYWIEKGFNEDNLVYLYPRLNNSITVIAVVMFVGYVLMHRTRKKISLKEAAWRRASHILGNIQRRNETRH
ncbi:unnamed protein product [Oikopleura dioica]|uniref:Uncharacterized protein n=1 Tax=Oikopleura dioica TaxID=34765 RepID=E4XRQ8_OIKDI|nr:unnamed protein product [Oikopleura dioica]